MAGKRIIIIGEALAGPVQPRGPAGSRKRRRSSSLSGARMCHSPTVASHMWSAARSQKNTHSDSDAGQPTRSLQPRYTGRDRSGVH